MDDTLITKEQLAKNEASIKQLEKIKDLTETIAKSDVKIYELEKKEQKRGAVGRKEKIASLKTIQALDKKALKIEEAKIKAEQDRVKAIDDKNKAQSEELKMSDGMASYVIKVTKERKKENDAINVGLTSLTKGLLIDKMKASNGAAKGSLAMAEAKSSKIIYEKQQRMAEEAASGVITERTKAQLQKEYQSEMGASHAILQANNKEAKRANKFAEETLSFLGNQSMILQNMSDEELPAIGGINSEVAGMASRWDDVKEKVQGTFDLVRGLMSNKLIAKSIFSYEVLKRVGELGKSFGGILNTGISLENMTGKIGGHMITASFTGLRFGATMKDTAEATKSIMDEMGSIDHLTHKNIDGTLKLMKYYDMSANSAAKLTKQFTHIGEMTGQTNEQLRRSVVEMANLGNVAPTKIFEDMASNAEAMAKWTDATGDNMQRLSVSSNQLGLSMSDTLGIMDGMIDFGTSIEKQMEASVLTGKSFNFEQARMMAFNGDHEGALKNIVSQLGTEHEWISMNMYQRKAMAEMLNVSVDKMQEMIVNQHKLGVETGKTSKAWENIYGGIKGAMGLITKDNIVMAGSFMGMFSGGGSARGIASGAGNLMGKLGGNKLGASKVGGLAKSVGGKVKSLFSPSKVTEAVNEGEGDGSELTHKKSGLAEWTKSWDTVKPASLGKIALGLGIIGLAMLGFGLVIATLPVDPKQYVAAGVMLGMLGASIYGLSLIGNKINEGGVLRGAFAMGIIGAALIPFAFALSLMENVNWTTLAIAGAGIIGLTAMVAGLGLLVAGPVGWALAAGLLTLISLSTGLLIFGKSLEILTQQADGMWYFADSLNMLVESMQNLAKLDGTLGGIKPVLKVIHKVGNAMEVEPTQTYSVETEQRKAEFQNNNTKMDKIIAEIGLLRQEMRIGMTLDGKKISKAMAGRTG